MEIHFATRKLADNLSSDKQRVRVFGAVMAKKIGLRLNALTAARNLETMRALPGGCHELHEDREGQLAVDLTGNQRFVFKPTEIPPPARDDGGLDWTAVTSVTILEVTDYHGK